MADDRTLPLPFGETSVPRGHIGPVVVPAHHEEDPPVATREGFPHGTEKSEIVAESPRATVAPGDPPGLPPRRLDRCDRCGSDGEEEPRRRVFFRRYAGPLLCVDCEKVVPR